MSYTDTAYDERASDADDPTSDPLYRQRWTAGFKVERQWRRHWNVFAEASWEDNDANDALEVYSHFSGVLGIGYVFMRGP